MATPIQIDAELNSILNEAFSKLSAIAEEAADNFQKRTLCSDGERRIFLIGFKEAALKGISL